MPVAFPYICLDPKPPDMKQMFYAASLAAVLVACSSESSEAQAETNGTEQTAEVVADRILTVEIEGMVCEMGCGSSIRKELIGLGGVSAIEFDFEDERKTNVAKVAFDKDLVTVDAIVKAITSINNGQFTVGKISSENLDPKHASHSDRSGEEESRVEVSASSFQMPNLLDILADVIL